MERAVVLDSQATAMDWVPDLQANQFDREHNRHRIRVALFGIIGVISLLVELITQLEEPQLEWSPGPQVTDFPDDNGINMSRRMRNIWSQFVQQSMTVFRVLYLEFDPTPMRRINCPWYCKPRTIQWFYLYIDWTPHWDPERFRHFFRISPDLFCHICDLVRGDMSSKAPEVFHCLPNRNLLVERQVAVAICRLATGDQLLGIAELFGLSASTASKVTWKFIKSFCRRGRHFSKWPEGPQMEEVKAGFQQRWNFPNCCGAIDATHFIIELPVGKNSTAYFDWKRNMSITMQAIVDNRCRFLDVLIGSSGSIQDSRVLRTSLFYHNVVYDRSKLNGPEFRTQSGYRLREYLLGDAGYPLYNWLIVPFPRGHSEAKDRWNHQHSTARMCVERSFGRLKGVWRILARVILWPKLNRLAPTVLTCVLLHNMMIHYADEVAPQVWNDVAAHPEGYGNAPRRNLEMFTGGVQTRNALQRHVTPW